MDFTSEINGIEEKLSSANAEQKRLQSIIEKKKSYQKQKSIIKAALSSVDTSNNKKTFNLENDIPCQTENTHKKSLFDNSDDDDGNIQYNFEVKNCYGGKKGKKLMELQSKVKDKRFDMDEQYLEEDENEGTDENIENRSAEHTNDTTEITKEEKQKELSILEDILGKSIKRSNDQVNKKSFSMLRYDPSNPEHTKYIINENEQPSPKKKRKIKEQTLSKQVEEKEKPSVSKETFYEVKENLKEALEQNNTFSFQFHSNENEENQNKNNDNIEAISVENRNIHRNSTKNPFQYDSSDDSGDEENFKNIGEDNNGSQINYQTNSENVTVPSRPFTEPFFFREDDYRLQEGIDFVRKFELDDAMEFKQVRRNIKEIVKTKVRKNQQKNKLFRKKLGGRKMIKFKKALKNK